MSCLAHEHDEDCAEDLCGCCGGHIDGLFPVVDRFGFVWCGSCFESESPEEEEDAWHLEQYGNTYPSICYRHECDKEWAKEYEELYDLDY